jgi:hypothetical protein
MYYRRIKQTTETTPRLSISYLQKHGVIKKGYAGSWVYRFNDLEFNIYSYNAEYIELKYQWGETTVTQKIHITYKPSNLKQGAVMFFVCPGTNGICKIIYQPQGNVLGFYSRPYFNNQLYYTSQTLNYKTKATYKAERLSGIIEAVITDRNQTHYKGIETKRYKRLVKLSNQYEKANAESWNQLYNYLDKP